MAASFLCPYCAARHDLREIGFRVPDAAYALGLDDDERDHYQNAGSPDLLAVRDGCYLRCVAPIPVHGWDAPFSLGLWAQVAPAAYADFVARDGAPHPEYEGRIANQERFFQPSLGLSCRVQYRGPGLRPTLSLAGHGPLARAQRDGMTPESVAHWCAELQHRGEPEPLGAAFEAAEASHGFALVDPYEAGRIPYAFAALPSVDDTVKVIVVCDVADVTGASTELVAGWWVRLDVVNATGPWSGTLASVPPMPATLRFGSRLWLQPGHVIEHASE